MDDEVWKPAIRFGVVIPNCFVSNRGRLRDASGKLFKIRNRPTGDGRGTGRAAESGFSMKIPKGLFKHRQDEGSGFIQVRFTVHRLVMETFKPLDENPPIPKDEWDELPESAKSIIRSCCLVDHIDNNPFNNTIDNLRWCTPLENNSVIKKKTFSESNEKKLSNTLEELLQ
jgi:hypothetical protein